MPKGKVWILIAAFALAPGLCAAQTSSERLEQLAAQSQERAVLAEGHLPISALRQRMNAWIETQTK